MKLQLHLATILFIILEHINRIFTQGIPISPCPKIFQYRFDGSEWFGILSVRNSDVGQALHLRVTLSLRGKPTTNYLGEIELLTRGQFLSETPVLYKIKFPKNHFPPKLLQITANNHVVCLGAADHSIFVTQIQLEHTRKFTFIPEDMPATLPLAPDGFTFPSSSSASSAGGLKDTFSHQQLPTDIGFATKHLPLASLEKNPAFNDICGTIDNRIRFQVIPLGFTTHGNSESADYGTAGGQLRPRTDTVSDSKGAGHPLVTSDGGDDETTDSSTDSNKQLQHQQLPSITRGAWPWLAAIYVNNLTSLDYQCGGTLVSARIVISSAHCFQLFRRRYTSNEVLVFLGRHNLKNWNEEGSLAAPVDDIYIHPDFDTHLNTYDADIAIVMLKHEVRFNTFIRPACMWTGSTKSHLIAGEHGIVVGWSLGHSNASNAGTASQATAVPRIVHTPIVTNEACFQANEQFRSLSSNRTFCAGIVTTAKQQRKLKASGPCTGDSGAGLMIFKNNRWVLRGTVSAALPSSPASTTTLSRSSCNNNQYVIYTDVAKFLDWIFAFIAVGRVSSS